MYDMFYNILLCRLSFIPSRRLFALFCASNLFPGEQALYDTNQVFVLKLLLVLEFFLFDGLIFSFCFFVGVFEFILLENFLNRLRQLNVVALVLM